MRRTRPRVWRRPDPNFSPPRAPSTPRTAADYTRTTNAVDPSKGDGLFVSSKAQGQPSLHPRSGTLTFLQIPAAAGFVFVVNCKNGWLQWPGARGTRRSLWAGDQVVPQPPGMGEQDAVLRGSSSAFSASSAVK